MTYNATKAKAKNIYHDLRTSPFESEFMGYVFKFSTQTHMDKFSRDVWKRKQWLDDSLSRRFYVPIDSGMIAAIQLYQQIEGRGFFVFDSGRCYESADDMQIVSELV